MHLAMYLIIEKLLYFFKFLAIFILLLFFSTSCTRNDCYLQQHQESEVLKIGETGFSQDEFEKYKNLIQQNGIQTDTAILKTVYGFYKKALIISYLKKNKYELNENEKLELIYQNKLDLIKLAIEEKTKDIKIREKEIKREFNRSSNKQIVIDYIGLPKKNKKIINECFSFLNSGGNIIDLINSRDELFNKIIQTYNGHVSRVNVRPGLFCNKISKFIYEGYVGDTKKIKTKSGYHIIKILYRNSSQFNKISEKELLFNLKKAKYLELGESPIQQVIKRNLLHIDYRTIDTANFSIQPLLNNTDTTIIAEYKGIKIYTNEIIKKIANLPFNAKIYFSNKACKPSAIASLILLDNNYKPFTTNELISELKNADNKINNDISEKTRFKSSEYEPSNVNYTTDYTKLEEYAVLKLREEANAFPWLFPYLFKESNKIKINYDVVNNTSLVKIDTYEKTGTLAFTKNYFFTAGHFLNELKELTRHSLPHVLKLDNAKKLIYSFFDEQYNIPPSQISINIHLLKNIILDFSEELDTYIISDKNITTRIAYPEDTVVVKFGNTEINIRKLRKLISQLPEHEQLIFKFNPSNLNKLWRLNIINKLIEQEIWIKEVYDMNLQNSKEYKNIKEINKQNSIIKSFLNSFNSQKPDSINCKLNNIINNPDYKLDIHFDSTYFKMNSELLNNIL